jgi:hypothetical protein
VSGQPPLFILYSPTVAPDAARAQVAQLVEQWTENPRVGGSSPPLGTIFLNKINKIERKSVVFSDVHLLAQMLHRFGSQRFFMVLQCRVETTLDTEATQKWLSTAKT